MILGCITIVAGLVIFIKNIFFSKRKNINLENSLGGSAICLFLVFTGVAQIVFNV